MASATDLPKLYQGVQKQSFGYKMLSTMGWKEGQGLVRPWLWVAVLSPAEQNCSHSSSMRVSLWQGANHQGIKEHIKVKKKQDAFGVGAVGVSCWGLLLSWAP